MLSMTPALSTDMYLPALPSMTAELATTEAMTSLTVTVFFVAMATGMLVLGTISDARGRCPMIMACSGIACAMCFVAIAAPSVWVLVLVRTVQGVAAGGMVSLATSLVKDCFEGRQMQVVMSVVQTAGMIAPTVAPLMGACILQFAHWKGIFVVLALFSAISFLGALAMGETLPAEQRKAHDMKAAFKGLATIARTPHLRTLTISSGFALMSFMPYLGVASFIYQAYFGLSEFGFGIMFGVASIIGAAGPMVYLKTSGQPLGRMMLLMMGVETASALLMLTVGHLHFMAFFFCMMPCLFLSTSMKPRVVTTMLNRTTIDAGATSSALNFTHTVIGSLGMVLVSSGFMGDRVLALGSVILIFAILAWATWLPMRKKVLPELE